MNFLDYYSQHSIFTDPSELSFLFDYLPDDIESLCAIVQGIMLLDNDAYLYNHVIPSNKLKEMALRYVSKMLLTIISLDERPIFQERNIEKKLIGNCRDFSILVCSILRHKNIPARIRMGFSAHSGWYTDKTILEYWDKTKNRWRVIDPVCTVENIKKNKIKYDPYDLNNEDYVFSGQAWKMYRLEEAEPDKFGASYMSGLSGWWYIRNKLIQDFCTINKLELLVWDRWDSMNQITLINSPKENFKLNYLDMIADVVCNKSHDIQLLNSLYESSFFKPSLNFNNSRLSTDQVNRIYWRLNNHS